jgi:glycosyltransferase involved in cell wall biosynthesis
VTLLGTKSRVIVASNGVSLTSIAGDLPHELPSDLLFVGRLLPNKNVDMLVRAAGIMKREKANLKVLIIGEGPEKESLKTLVHTLGLSDNVTFVGFLDDNSKVYGMMKTSKVFVFPSTREGFGIVALEANACGLPVITIDVEQNATRSLIKQGQNGMLTNLDEKEIAAAASQLLTTRKEPAYYRSYAEKYDWDTIVKGVEQIYSND